MKKMLLIKTDQKYYKDLKTEWRPCVIIDLNNVSIADTAGWSKVHAFFDHDDLVAKIQLEDDTYVIEVCSMWNPVSHADLYIVNRCCTRGESEDHTGKKARKGSTRTSPKV